MRRLTKIEKTILAAVGSAPRSREALTLLVWGPRRMGRRPATVEALRMHICHINESIENSGQSIRFMRRTGMYSIVTERGGRTIFDPCADAITGHSLP